MSNYFSVLLVQIARNIVRSYAWVTCHFVQKNWANVSNSQLISISNIRLIRIRSELYFKKCAFRAMIGFFDWWRFLVFERPWLLTDYKLGPKSFVLKSNKMCKWILERLRNRLKMIASVFDLCWWQTKLAVKWKTLLIKSSQVEYKKYSSGIGYKERRWNQFCEIKLNILMLSL